MKKIAEMDEDGREQDKKGDERQQKKEDLGEFLLAMPLRWPIQG